LKNCPTFPKNPGFFCVAGACGAGIVVDSVLELERQESINKAQAVTRAIGRTREV